MQKKGDVRFALLEIVLLSMVLVAFFQYHVDVRDDTLFTKSFVARDIALLLETAQSVPGDVELYYRQPNFDIGAYNYDFDGNIVQISEPDVTAYSISYPFFIDLALDNTLAHFETPSAFLILKEKGVFTVDSFASLSSKSSTALLCPHVVLTKTNKHSIAVLALDPSLGPVRDAVLGHPSLDFAKKINDDALLDDSVNLLITLEEGRGKEVQIVTLVGDDGHAERLGCLIANNILGRIDSAVLFPVTQRADPILSENPSGIAVSVVVGNELLADPQGLYTAVLDAIDSFYGYDGDADE